MSRGERDSVKERERGEGGGNTLDANGQARVNSEDTEERRARNIKQHMCPPSPPPPHNTTNAFNRGVVRIIGTSAEKGKSGGIDALKKMTQGRKSLEGVCGRETDTCLS